MNYDYIKRTYPVTPKVWAIVYATRRSTGLARSRARRSRRRITYRSGLDGQSHLGSLPSDVARISRATNERRREFVQHDRED